MKKRKNYSAFTLLEMLIVLLIISVLLLLFVPNLSDQREKIQTKGTDALEKVIDAQVELYRLETGSTPTYGALVSNGYLTSEQAKEAEIKKIKIK